MITNNFTDVIADQKLEITNFDLSKVCDRREEAFFDLSSPLVQIVIGVRRCGKSTICHKVLLQSNIKYAYVNFDDERLLDVKTEQLNEILEALYMVYGDFNYLFLDEIQNVSGWNLFVNRLLRQKMHLVITGSNAKLLSNELGTYLTGRYNQIELYPLSFIEYLQLKDINEKAMSTKDLAFRNKAFEDYLMNGGFPELLLVKDTKGYINRLVGNIINVDIMQRFKIRYKDTLIKIADYLISNFAQEVNYANIAKIFNVGSDNTAANYVNYLKQTYLVIGLNKFSYKAKIRIRSEKLYLIDPALFTSQDNHLSSENIGYKLENIVYLELLRRKTVDNTNIFYFNDGFEIDFVVCEMQQAKELIQVSMNIDSEKTFKREVNALVKASGILKCKSLILLTLRKSQIHIVDKLEIKEISIIDWLCNT